MSRPPRHETKGLLSDAAGSPPSQSGQRESEPRGLKSSGTFSPPTGPVRLRHPEGSRAGLIFLAKRLAYRTARLSYNGGMVCPD